MRERLERLLNIRPDEWGELWYFGLLNTLLWTGLTIGESVGETLFLKRVGVEHLPKMFILCSLFAIPIGIVYDLLQQRIERRRLSSMLGVSAVTAVLICLFLIDGGWTIGGSVVGYPLLYIVQNILSTVLAAHFTILLSGQFNTLDSKRLIPIILGGAVAGSITGGLSVRLLADSFGTANLLWIWVFMLGIGEVWFAFGGRSLKAAMWAREEKDTAPKYAGEGRLDRWFYEARAVVSTPLLMLLAASMFMMTICRYFIEYQYSEIFNAHFTSEAALAGFIGVYTVASNLTALAIQSVVTGRLIQTLGVSSANLFYPVSTLLAFTGTALSYTILPGVFARFNQEGLRRAVFHPVISLFYNAIPAKRRARSIAFNEGIMIPLGTIAAGIMIMAMQSHRQVFLAVSMALAAVWSILAWGQRQVYSRSLIELLRRSQIESIADDEKDLGTLDGQTQSLVIEALKDDNDEVAELAADLLIRYGAASARAALLRQAVDARPSLLIILLEKLASFPGPDTRQFLLRSLCHSNAEVRLSALKALIVYPHDDEIRARIAEFLSAADVRHRTTAAAGMVRGGDLGQMMNALSVLQQMLHEKDSDIVALGIHSLGLTRDERFWVNLRPFLISEDPKLRLAAMRSMNLMVQAGEIYEHLDILQSLIRDSVREIRTLAIRIVGRVRARQSVPLLLEALSDSSPRNRRLAFEALSGWGPDILTDLLMILDDPQASIHAQESAVRLLRFSQDLCIQERLARFGFAQIRTIYELKCDELTVVGELSADGSEFLRMSLNERAQGLLKLVLALVAPEESREARTVFRGLYSPNQEMMSNAIEALQSMGERTLIYHIVPVLEGLPLEQIAEYGRRTFGIEMRTARMVIGKHLVSIEKNLKEAAIYTVGINAIADLQPALKKILNADAGKSSIATVCAWSIAKLADGITCSEIPGPGTAR